MSVIIIGVHVSVCFLLILVVLLQAGKGSNMGSAIGGSSQSIVDSGSASNFLTKATTIAAIVFMITSLTMGYMQSKNIDSIMENFEIKTSDLLKPGYNFSPEEENIVENNNSDTLTPNVNTTK